MPMIRMFALVGAMAILSACSTISGGGSGSASAVAATDDLVASQEKAAELEVEVSRLKSENARLANLILALERARDDREEEEEIAKLEASKPAPRRIANSEPESIAVPPVNEAAVVAEAAAPDIRETDVPLEQAPRLVQPNFVSTEAVYENEAVGEIETESVLFGVHLASYREIPEAQEGWRKLQRENPEELGLLEPRVERITLPGKGEFLRLIGGGFSSDAKAADLCDLLKAKGLFCSVSGFGGDPLSLSAG